MTLEELYTAAIQDVHSGQYMEAIRKLELFLTHEIDEGDKANICSLLGGVYLMVGSNEKGVERLVQALAITPNNPAGWSNLSEGWRRLGRLDDAVETSRKAIALKPDFAEAHSNLGVTLQKLGRLDEAEASLKQAIALKPDYAEAYYNFGVTLQELDRLDEAEVSLKKAIALKPDFAEAHSNLGVTLKKLVRLNEAEASFRQAIALEPDFAEAHSNLGSTLKDLSRLDEAEASCRKAIALKSDLAEAHSNLGIILYGNGDLDSALISVERANFIDPESNSYRLFLSVLRAKKARTTFKFNIVNINTSDFNIEHPSKLFMSNKFVKEELIIYLSELDSLDLEKENDPSFGNTRGSMYELFNDGHSTIKKLEDDLTTIMMDAVKSEIYIHTSFFSIFGAGGGTNRHNHLNQVDKDPILSLADKKYSLVYYVSVGNQKCKDPGVLRLYDPSEYILPNDGLITIFPADRYHSSIYGGNENRIIVGVNFYSL